MQKVMVIFTGINFSHHMAEHAINWAASNKAPLQALFLKAGKEEEEGYPYPSDLDAAEKLTDRKDAERDDLNIIRDYEKILHDLGKEKNVWVSTEIRSDPSLEEIVSLTKESAIVFVDASYDPSDVLSPREFTLEKLQQRSRAPVKIISGP
jgi:hypothetical protein